MTVTTKTFTVRGFHCSGCADTLARSLRALEGVIRADTDYDQARVEVRFDAGRATEDDIRERIRASGYDSVGA